MKRYVIKAILLSLIFFTASAGFAQEENNDKLTISGFFDVTASYNINDSNDKDADTFEIVYELGDVEIDLEHQLSEKATAEAALVFNDGTAEVTVAKLNYHLLDLGKSNEGNRYGISLDVGRFDVPFGKFYEISSAPDNISISAPMTTENVIDGGFNDTGLNLSIDFQLFNLNTYMLQGLDSGNAYGGRAGINFINFIEGGISYMHDVNGEWDKELTAAALDLTVSMKILKAMGEYYIRDVVQASEIYDGFQVTGIVDLSPLSLPFRIFARFDQLRLRNSNTYKIFDVDGTTARKLSGGINMSFSDAVIFKAEYSQYIQTYDAIESADDYNEKSLQVQLVVTF